MDLDLRSESELELQIRVISECGSEFSQQIDSIVENKVVGWIPEHSMTGEELWNELLWNATTTPRLEGGKGKKLLEICQDLIATGEGCLTGLVSERNISTANPEPGREKA